VLALVSGPLVRSGLADLPMARLSTRAAERVSRFGGRGRWREETQVEAGLKSLKMDSAQWITSSGDYYQ
jgi:hypothetical protein